MHSRTELLVLQKVLHGSDKTFNPWTKSSQPLLTPRDSPHPRPFRSARVTSDTITRVSGAGGSFIQLTGSLLRDARSRWALSFACLAVRPSLCGLTGSVSRL